MKTTGKQGMSVEDFLKGVDSCNEHIEANLSTMFQSVRGTKQFWFLKKSDLNCMIREYGPLSLFLTFSCAEYDSPDIASYLHKVNDVPDGYPIGKLCAGANYIYYLMIIYFTQKSLSRCSSSFLILPHMALYGSICSDTQYTNVASC